MGTRRRRDKGVESLFEQITAETSPFWGRKQTFPFQVLEAQSAPNKGNPRKTTPRHKAIKIAMIKDKERILKAAREKQLPVKKTPSGYQ